MLERELRYIWLSRAWVVLLVVLVAGMGLAFYNANSAVNYARAAYLDNRRLATEDGQNPDELLSKPAKTTRTTEGDTVLTSSDNPVRTSYDEYMQARIDFGATSLPSVVLGWTVMLIGPIAFTAWGVFMATYDYGCRTVKVKASQGRWERVSLAKVAASSIVLVAVVAAMLALAVVGSNILGVGDAAQVARAAAHGPSVGLLAAQYFVALFVAWVFSALGFGLGILMRRQVWAILVVVAYNMFVPALGRMDLKNLVASAIHQVFTFPPMVQLLQPIPVPTFTTYAGLAAMAGTAIVIAYACTRFQSKYVR